MPLRSWRCPATGRTEPFGHFETCEEGPHGTPGFPAWLAAMIEEKVHKDVRHSTLDATATMTMDCPRRVFIERTSDYVGDPRVYETSSRGTALHAVAASRMNPEVWYTEANDPVRLDLRGVLFGVPISALVDALRRDLTEILDHKFPKDTSAMFRPSGFTAPSKEGVKWKNVEYSCQLNMARLLLAQQPWAIEAGYDPDNVKLTLVDHAIGKNGGAKHYRVRHMTEDEIANVRPWDSTRTIQQHVDTLVAARKALELAQRDEEREAVIASIPLLGASMLGGNKCSYCEVKVQCDGLVRKHGRPM